MNNFGRRLKTARKAKGLTQKALAQRLNVEQSTISNYEKNVRIPSAATLIELSKQLQVTVDDLLGRSIPESTDERPEVSIEASGSSLSEQEILDLRTAFFDHLIQGHIQDDFDLIQQKTRSDMDALFFNVNVFEPVMKKLGVLWETGEINVAEEHLVSDAVTRFMMRLEQEQPRVRAERSYSVLLMLPGAEEHELPLRMIEAVFQRHGWKTYYLGHHVPLAGFSDFLRKRAIDLLAVSVTIRAHLASCELLIQSIKAMDPLIRPAILVGGSAIDSEAVALDQLGADFYVESQQALDKAMRRIESALTSKEQV